MFKLQQAYQLFDTYVTEDKASSYRKFKDSLLSKLDNRENKYQCTVFEQEYIDDVFSTFGEQLKLGLYNLYDYKEIGVTSVLPLTIPMIEKINQNLESKVSNIVIVNAYENDLNKLRSVIQDSEINITECKPEHLLSETEDTDTLYVISLINYTNINDILDKLQHKNFVLFAMDTFIENINNSVKFHELLSIRGYSMDSLEYSECLLTNFKGHYFMIYVDNDKQIQDTGVEYFMRDEVEADLEYTALYPKMDEENKELNLDIMVKADINAFAFMKNSFNTRVIGEVSSYPLSYNMALTKDNIDTVAMYQTILKYLKLDTTKRVPKYKGNTEKENYIFNIYALMNLFMTNENILDFEDYANNFRIDKFIETEDSGYTVFYLLEHINKIIKRNNIDMQDISEIEDLMNFINNVDSTLNDTDIFIFERAGYTQIKTLLEENYSDLSSRLCLIEKGILSKTNKLLKDYFKK